MIALSDKVVLITGGSGGLERCLARAFAWQGYRVGITSRDSEKLSAAAEEIANSGSRCSHCPVTLDTKVRLNR